VLLARVGFESVGDSGFDREPEDMLENGFAPREDKINAWGTPLPDPALAPVAPHRVPIGGDFPAPESVE